MLVSYGVPAGGGGRCLSSLPGAYDVQNAEQAVTRSGKFFTSRPPLRVATELFRPRYHEDIIVASHCRCRGTPQHQGIKEIQIERKKRRIVVEGEEG